MEYFKLKGTYDILPEESDFYLWIIETIRNEASLFGYKEVFFPVIEYASLFLRGVGEASDIVVKKEMYVFEDRGKRLIALRPEGTASSVRLFLENNLFMKGYSAKLFYFGPMFRAENPQTGRYRQFYQFGFEYLGDGTPYVDAELIKLNISIFNKLGIGNYRLYINSIGCKNCRSKYFEKLKEFFGNYISEMCDDCKVRYEKNILRILDCKEEKCQTYISRAPKSLDFLCEDCKKHFDELQQILLKENIDFVIDHRLVRGLDYYNKTVFEFKSDILGAQSTFSAGGRYDYLVKELGGMDTPACGFAIGMERLGMVVELSNSKKKVDYYISPVVYVATVGTENIHKSIEIIKFFRENGISTTTEYKHSNLKKHLRSADKMKCKYVLFVGENEIKNQKYILRRLSDGFQWEDNLDGILSIIRKN